MAATRIVPPTEEAIIKKIWRMTSGVWRREVPTSGVYVNVMIKMDRVITTEEETILEGLINALPLCQASDVCVILDAVPSFVGARADLIVDVKCQPVNTPVAE